MRKAAFVFVFAAVILCFQIAAGSNTVSLTAADVTSASDIERAIGEATGQGAHPGVVILDASQGPFTYIDLDRTVNIADSGVTLRSENGATITNCDDGILFEGSSADNIVIEGITFHCLNSGMLAVGGGHQMISIRGNVIEAPGFGVQVTGGHDWAFTTNVIHAGVDAINLVGTTGALVYDNELSGYEIALFLDHANGNKVHGNQIHSNWQGILLTYGASTNKINGNTITGPRHSGISLEGGNSDNKIHGNMVTCAAGHQCTAVSGPPHVFEINKISGNKVQ